MNAECKFFTVVHVLYARHCLLFFCNFQDSSQVHFLIGLALAKCSGVFLDLNNSGFNFKTDQDHKCRNINGAFISYHC